MMARVRERVTARRGVRGNGEDMVKGKSEGAGMVEGFKHTLEAFAVTGYPAVIPVSATSGLMGECVCVRVSE